MNTHTPEPWAAVRNTAYWEIGTEIDGYYANRIGDVCATDPNNPDSGKQEANANRIVACVNACAGMADPASEIAALKAQRDELLEACRAARELIEGGDPGASCDTQEEAEAERCRWRNGIESYVKAAITKAEGGAA